MIQKNTYHLKSYRLLFIITSIVLFIGISISVFAGKIWRATYVYSALSCLSSTSSRLTIQSSGEYQICNGQNYTQGIDISASNITLDCSGSTIDGGGKQETGITIISQNNVSLKNCNVKNFFVGVKASNSNAIFIENNDVSDNSAGSPFKNPGSQNNPVANLGDQNQDAGGGIVFENIKDSKILNTISSRSVTGVMLLNSQNITIDGGNYSYNSGWGIKLKSSTNNIIRNITANNNNRWCNDGYGIHQGCETSGILLIDQSNNNIIDNNTINSNGDGLYINGCSGHQPSNTNTIQNNSADNNSSNGFEATFSTGNTFINNNISGSNYGFWLGYSDHSIVQNNTVKSANGGAINIANSICNAVVGNTANSSEPQNNKIWVDSSNSDCGTGKPKSCRDNLLSSNTPQLVSIGCINTQSSNILSSCGMSITPMSTPSPSGPTPTGGGTGGVPTPTSGSGGGGVNGEKLKVEVWVTYEGQNPRLWSAADGHAKVYISGPTRRGPFAFSVVMDIPTDPNKTICHDYEKHPFPCRPGVITWEGAPRNGTFPGSYSVQFINSSSLPLTPTPNPNPMVELAPSEVKTVKLYVVGNQASSPTLPPGTTITPTPTREASIPAGYTNEDFRKVISAYQREELTALAVSLWVRHATRVPALQISFCDVRIPGDCEGP